CRGRRRTEPARPFAPRSAPVPPSRGIAVPFVGEIAAASPPETWLFGSEGGGGSAARYRGSAILTVFDAEQDQESPCGDGPYAHVRAAGGLARRDRARRGGPRR